jgi:hypothetical protein
VTTEVSECDVENKCNKGLNMNEVQKNKLIW